MSAITEDVDLTIGEIAQSYRVSLRTVRFYEERGLLTPRRVGQVRYYGEREEARLQAILKAKRMGLSLSQIARLLERDEAPSEPIDVAAMALTRSQIEARIAMLLERRRTTDAAIEELRVALIDAPIGHDICLLSDSSRHAEASASRPRRVVAR